MTNTEIKIRLEKILVRNEQRKANKLIPADLLDIKDIIKQLSICDVRKSSYCVCKKPNPKYSVSNNEYCNKCLRDIEQ